jgi:diguanylate cyclase (GGDEF)-like protein
MDKITAKGRAWLLYLLVGVLAMAVYFLLPSAVAQNVCLAVVEASAVAAIVAGIRMYRPVHPLPWCLFAFGIGLVLVGDIVWAGYTLRVGPPYPSVADVFYLLGVLVFLVGLLLVGGWGLSKHAASLIDLLIVATGVAMLSWVLVLQPRFDPGSSLPLEPLLLVVYLLLYVVMLAVVVRPLFVPAKRVPALYLICAAPAILVASEAAYGSLASGDYEAYVAGSPVYVGQLFFLALLGTAALHPSMAPLTEPAPPAPAELTWWRLTILSGALTMAPVLAALQAALGQPVNSLLIAGSSAVLFVLVTVRMAGMIAERKTLERRLQFQASHDPVTGLPNRSLFTDRFDAALSRSARRGSNVAILFVDLDDFKRVNDSWGHEAGDRVLVAVARRLRACLRPSDTAARMGGDEFAILLEDLEDCGGAVRVAKRILEELRAPVPLGDSDALVGASIGIALDDARARIGDLLRKADVALYRAKDKGKGGYEVFSPDLGERIKT